MQYTRFQGIQTVEGLLRREVLAYLDEKLSPGQMGVSGYFQASSLDAQGVSMSFMPRYEIGKIGGGKIVWFRVKNVPQKYWDEVVHPGLEYIADRFDKGIGFATPTCSTSHVIEFCLW